LIIARNDQAATGRSVLGHILWKALVRTSPSRFRCRHRSTMSEPLRSGSSGYWLPQSPWWRCCGAA